jgi:hypothetical protein
MLGDVNESVGGINDLMRRNYIYGPLAKIRCNAYLTKDV